MIGGDSGAGPGNFGNKNVIAEKLLFKEKSATNYNV